MNNTIANMTPINAKMPTTPTTMVCLLGFVTLFFILSHMLDVVLTCVCCESLMFGVLI